MIINRNKQFDQSGSLSSVQPITIQHVTQAIANSISLFVYVWDQARVIFVRFQLFQSLGQSKCLGGITDKLFTCLIRLFIIFII